MERDFRVHFTQDILFDFIFPVTRPSNTRFRTATNRFLLVSPPNAPAHVR